MKYLILLFPSVCFGLTAIEARNLSEKNFKAGYSRELKECNTFISNTINNAVRDGRYSCYVPDYCSSRVVEDSIATYRLLGFTVKKPYTSDSALTINW